MDMASPRRLVSEIIAGLSSASYPRIVHAIDNLEKYLVSLVPSIELHSKDARLSAFLGLQDSFQYNLVAACLDAHAFFRANPTLVDPIHILAANQCMCGLLLIHSDSRKLFARRSYMALVLSLLDKLSPLWRPDVCVSVLSLLVHILLKSATNLRVFEALQGLKSVSQHLYVTDDSLCDASGQDLSLKVVEFFIFYLTDERGLEGEARSVESKKQILQPEFSGIDDLLRNLEDLTILKTDQHEQTRA